MGSQQVWSSGQSYSKNRASTPRAPTSVESSLRVPFNRVPSRPPVTSNSGIIETIYLIQIGDLQVPGENGGYDVASFIGVRKGGTFVPNLLLHSDMPGASPFANESVKIRFTPETCHYSKQSAN
jgi:hypothetical protein